MNGVIVGIDEAEGEHQKVVVFHCRTRAKRVVPYNLNDPHWDILSNDLANPVYGLSWDKNFFH